jgi:hypothetical protein
MVPPLFNKMADLTKLPSFPSKPRVFILSDIENEPDDQESLVRYLLYANEFDTRGICAVTSAWLPTRTAPESMRKIVEAYGKVVGNLNHHVHPGAQYPPAEVLMELVTAGASVWLKISLGLATRSIDNRRYTEKKHSPYPSAMAPKCYSTESKSPATRSG